MEVSAKLSLHPKVWKSAVRFPKVSLSIKSVYIFSEDGYGALEHLLEGDERLSAADPEAELVMYHLKQVGVVACVNFGKYIICAGGEVAVHHFGDLAQAFHYLVEFGRVVEDESYVCAGLKSHCGRIDLGFETFDDP